MIKYITYNLLFMGGLGYGPTSAVPPNVDFEGGLYGKEGRLFGHLEADSEDLLDETLSKMAAWDIKELTLAEAKAWADYALPVNTQDPEGDYAQVASLDENDKIRKEFGEQVDSETAASKNEAYSWIKIRNKRNTLLGDSDWTDLPNAPLTSEEKSQWQSYRQDLRDIPQDFSDPDSVIWPTFGSSSSSSSST